MSKTVSDIYDKYKIMPALQNHMLRVAGVASLICDSIENPVNRKDLIITCLLHDMGNIIKSNLEYFPEFLEPKGLKYWQKVKDEYFKKYGASEHLATLKIIKEIGVSNKVSDLITRIDFSEIFDILSKPIENQISLYADCRVSPFGIVSFQERFLEGKNRYKNRKNRITDEQWKIAEDIILKVENNIFSKCKIKPEDINDETVKPIISELKNFVVK